MNRNLGFLAQSLQMVSENYVKNVDGYEIPNADAIISGELERIVSPNGDASHDVHRAAQFHAIVTVPTRLKILHDKHINAEDADDRKMAGFRYYQALSHALKFAYNNFSMDMLADFILMIRDGFNLELNTDLLLYDTQEYVVDILGYIAEGTA